MGEMSTTSGASNVMRSEPDLEQFIALCHEAITQQSQGHPEPFLDLWSHAEDVTVMAAIGGYQVGFGPISDLLTAASKTQQFDSWSAENLVTIVDRDLAFSVELEHYGKSGQENGMTIRATMIYRREAGQWRVIHRHGDVLTPIAAKW